MTRIMGQNKTYKDIKLEKPEKYQAGFETEPALKTVTVIMSTYNGEPYIREQIDSILAQTWPDLTLYIRDDGSTDGTWEILKSYASGSRPGRRIICRRGKNRGFAPSFLKGLHDCPQADYYAWADQDDIWLPGKIERAIQRLNKADNVDCPVLYFSDYDDYDEKMRFLCRGLVHTQGPSFANSLVDCITLGFNSVFNHRARQMILEKLPRRACGHDWWTYMVCAAFGQVIYDRGYVSAKYRRTDASLGLGGNGWVRMQWLRFRKLFINRYFGNIRRQQHEFAKFYLAELEREGDRAKAYVLRLFARDQHSPGIVLRKVLYPGRFRQTLPDELMVRILFLLGRL